MSNIKHVIGCICGDQSIDFTRDQRCTPNASERQLIEKIERCTICMTPAPSGETNDKGECESCIVRSFFSLPMMAHVAAAHVFLCHAGNADDCRDGCDANADRRRMKLYIDIGDQVALMRAAVYRRNS